tara:strand:+ start:1704 stop:3164 length:1461 start_codon:yes stop_codon:yes gene_type:complete
MKLILNESQYNRIFNNKKRKVVVTESQYNRLLNESTSSFISKVKVGNILKVTRESSGGKEVLTFRVISKDYNNIVMVSCDSGVYKNAYFLLDGNPLSGKSLAYKSVQDKNLSKDKSILDDLKKGRASRWNNVEKISGYDDGTKIGDGQKTGCKLFDKAKKEFSLDVDTLTYDDSNDKPKDDKPKDDKSNEDKILEKFRGLKKDYGFALQLSDKSIIYFDVLAVTSNSINLEIVETKGEGASRYSDSKGSRLIFDINKKNIVIKKEDPLTFDIKIDKYIGGEDDKATEIEIWDVVNFKVTSSLDDDYDINFTDKEMQEYFKQFIDNSDLLQASLYKRPNFFLELIGFARERGMIPAEGKLAELGFYIDKHTEKLKFYDEFESNDKIDGEFIKLEFKDSYIRENEKIRVVLKKLNKEGDYPVLYTDFTSDVADDKKTLGKIIIGELLEERDDFNVYKASIFSKSSLVKKEFTKKGEGKFKIIKQTTKD